MKKYYCFGLLISLLIISGCGKKDININYKSNPEPLLQNAYIKLPLGIVKPSGWLKSQLENQSEGLTGNLDDFWPDLVNSSWRGSNGEAWERGPLFPRWSGSLAYLLNDERLISKVKKLD